MSVTSHEAIVCVIVTGDITSPEKLYFQVKWYQAPSPSVRPYQRGLRLTDCREI
jgi:hypothetical protein